jgi:mRNA interferase ChpB
MISRRTPDRGDVYWIDPNPTSGREMRGRHRFVVITLQVINTLGLVMAVPVTSGGEFSRETGMTIPSIGYDTQGVAVCNQMRTFDVEARVKTGTARFVEKLDSGGKK